MALLHKIRVGKLAGLLCLCGAIGTAQGLELQECFELALTQNPDILVSQSQMAQAQAGLNQAQGARLPKLTASMTGTRTNDALNAFGLKLSQRGATFNDFGAGQFNPSAPGALSVAPTNLNYPSAVTNYNTRLEMLIPLYNGGMISGYVDQAHAYVKAAHQGDLAARQQVIFHVIQAYQGLHTARAYVKVTLKAQTAAEAYLKTTQNLLHEGVVVRSDLLSAQVNLADIKVKLAEATRSEAAANDQLHLLLGKPLGEALEIGRNFTPKPLQGDVAGLQELAVQNNPGLMAMRAQLDAVSAGVKVALADYYPHFNAMLRQDWNAATPAQSASSYTVAGVLSWQVLDFGATRGAVGRAEASRSELLAKLKQAEDGVRYQVADASRGVDEAQLRVDARATTVVQAAEAQRLVAKRYENGVTTMVEMLSVQAQLDKARADAVAAEYQLIVQRSALRLATGQLDKDQL